MFIDFSLKRSQTPRPTFFCVCFCFQYNVAHASFTTVMLVPVLTFNLNRSSWCLFLDIFPESSQLSVTGSLKSGFFTSCSKRDFLLPRWDDVEAEEDAYGKCLQQHRGWRREGYGCILVPSLHWIIRITNLTAMWRGECWANLTNENWSEDVKLGASSTGGNFHKPRQGGNEALEREREMNASGTRCLLQAEKNATAVCAIKKNAVSPESKASKRLPGLP